MLITAAAATAAVTSLFSVIANSDSAKKAGGEFLDAAWNDIKPWLIKEDDTPETKVQIEYAIKEVKEKQEITPLTEPLLRPRLEQHIIANPTDFQLLEELIAKGKEVMNIDNSTTNVNNENATIGNQFNNTKISGDFNLGDMPK